MTLLFKPTLAFNKTPDITKLKYPLYASPKLDGFRCIIADGVPFSRYMKRIPNLFVQREIMKLQQHGFDGELMVDGDFESAQSAFKSAAGEPNFTLHVFDYFDCRGGYKERYKVLQQKVLELDAPRIKLVHQELINTPKELQGYWDLCIDAGFEGAMTRCLSAPYKNGRSTLSQEYLLKLKVWHDDEAEIIGFEEMQSNQNEAFEGELGQTKRQTLKENMVDAGTLGALVVKWNGVEFKIGSGFDLAKRSQLWSIRNEIKGKKVTFKYQQLTRYGKPRFPIYKALRENI